MRRALEVLRRGLGWVTAAYVIGLCVLLLALEWWGERFWLFGVLLYAPIQVCLLPLGVLTPLCLLFRRRLVLWHALAAVILIFGYMTFRWSSAPPIRGSELKAVTFNYGESNRAQFMAFLQAEQPDVLLLQDARGRGADLVTKIPGMYAERSGPVRAF